MRKIIVICLLSGGVHEDFLGRSDDFSHQNELTPDFSDILQGMERGKILFIEFIELTITSWAMWSIAQTGSLTMGMLQKPLMLLIDLFY